MRSFARKRWRAGGIGIITGPSPHDAVPEVRDARGLDHPRALELELAVDPVEQARPAAQEQRGEVDLELVHQACLEVLPDDTCSSRDGDVFAAGRPSGLF